jgi:hypothetical protein
MQLDNKLVRSRYGATGSLYGKSPCKHGAEAACGVAGFSLLTREDVRCKLADYGAAIFLYNFLLSFQSDQNRRNSMSNAIIADKCFLCGEDTKSATYNRGNGKVFMDCTNSNCGEW